MNQVPSLPANSRHRMRTTTAELSRRLIVYVFVCLCAALRLAAQEMEGAVIYRTQCAGCHENPASTRAPGLSSLRLMPAQNILMSLLSGPMKDQGSRLTPQQKRSVAGYLARGSLAEPQPALCADSKAPFIPSNTDWNGWGADLANTRFQRAERAGLTADQVLRLKWFTQSHTCRLQ